MAATNTGTDNIDIAPENADFEAVDVDTNDDDTGDATGQGNIPAAPAAAGANAPASFNLRVEQNKIPEFFGAKSKDTISAADYIRRLEDLAKTNRWTDAQTYHHFANSLRNPAREWLSSIVDWNTDENARLVWSDFKEPFKQEYAVQTNDKLILDGLSNLAMKPNETTNELLTRITRTTRVIRESFDEYDAKIPYPHNDVNGGISNATFRRFLRQYDAMWVNFFKMNLFKAALTPELRSVVAQQEQDTITIKKMYQVATTAQRELKGKGPALVNEVREEEPMAESETDDVAAFNRRGARPRSNQAGGSSRGTYNSGRGGYQTSYGRGSNNSGSGNNNNRNGKYCYFCKLQGHRQEECRKRMKENKPCRDAQGRYYWPKIYVMDDNDAKTVSSIDHEEETRQHSSHIAEISNAHSSPNTRTAALSPDYSGFQ
jgi:hypothetical protein